MAATGVAREVGLAAATAAVATVAGLAAAATVEAWAAAWAGLAGRWAKAVGLVYRQRARRSRGSRCQARTALQQSPLLRPRICGCWPS